MNNNCKGVIGLILILLIATYTNPSPIDHKEKIKKTFTAYYQNSAEENKLESENSFVAIGSLLGESLMNKIIENAVTSDNYVFFSITKINYRGEKKSIGYGIFGTVFLYEKIENAFNAQSNR